AGGPDRGAPRRVPGRARAGREEVIKAAAIAAAAALALPATADAADRTVVTDPTATNVSGHNTQMVWSSLGRDGRARLMRLVDGAPSRVPVRAKDGLF